MRFSTKIAVWIITGYGIGPILIAAFATALGLAASHESRMVSDGLAPSGLLLIALMLLFASAETLPKILLLALATAALARRYPVLDRHWTLTLVVGVFGAAVSACIAYFLGFGCWFFDQVYDFSCEMIPSVELAALTTSLGFIAPRILIRGLRPGHLVASGPA